MRIFIAAPDIWQGDAVGNHCFGLMRMAGRIGFEARLYAQRFSSGVAPIEQLFEDITENDTLILSYSIYDPLLEKFLALPCRKLCYFHGVTPAELLQELDPVTADLCSLSLSQFKELQHFDIIIANSEFTAGSLAPYIPFEQAYIIPPVFGDMPIFRCKKSSKAPSSDLEQKKLLLVGRVVPHKCIEDAIDILSKVRKAGVDACLTIIGGTPNRTYLDLLNSRAQANHVGHHVTITGALDDENLSAYFNEADILLSVSRHEGFCVPVLEAMHLGIPSLVRVGTAASEVGSNSVLHFSDLDEASQSVVSLLRDAAHAAKFRNAGQRRSAELLALANDNVWLKFFTVRSH